MISSDQTSNILKITAAASQYLSGEVEPHIGGGGRVWIVYLELFQLSWYNWWWNINYHYILGLCIPRVDVHKYSKLTKSLTLLFLSWLTPRLSCISKKFPITSQKPKNYLWIVVFILYFSMKTDILYWPLPPQDCQLFSMSSLTFGLNVTKYLRSVTPLHYCPVSSSPGIIHEPEWPSIRADLKKKSWHDNFCLFFIKQSLIIKRGRIIFAWSLFGLLFADWNGDNPMEPGSPVFQNN